MAIREILRLGDSRLREKCRELADPTAEEVLRVINDLRDTVEASFRETGYGRAIAAPQIGEMVRIVFLSARVAGRELVLINPRMVSHSSETEKVWDGCLSFLSIFMRVQRYKRIDVEYLDTSGACCNLEAGAENDLAELLQHEIDHLDGVLCIDRVRESSDIVSREYFESNFSVRSAQIA
jgi:peptide deformylase